MGAYLFIGFYLGFLAGVIVEFLRRDKAEAREREKKNAAMEARGLREYTVYEITGDANCFECPTCGTYLSVGTDE